MQIFQGKTADIFLCAKVKICKGADFCPNFADFSWFSSGHSVQKFEIIPILRNEYEIIPKVRIKIRISANLLFQYEIVLYQIVPYYPKSSCCPISGKVLYKLLST